nr:CoA transferase [uncultured Cohaesibacter sp.]
MSSENTRPLDGVRILDFTRVLAGPYCTAMLADLGAEVIKVEAASGDDYRHVGPFRGDESLLFQTVNRGKKSIILNLKDEQDKKAAIKLAGQCDVVIENFRPGVMDRLGLGAEFLQAAYPSLVFVSVSGFGQTGPNSHLPAYDMIIQAMSGLMDITGEAERQPMMVGDAIADVAAGMFAAFGIMVALYEREKTGKGRQVDLALYDSLLSMLPLSSCRALTAGQRPTRTGNRHALSAPFGTYPAMDGYFAVAVLNDRLFKSFAEVIGAPQLAQDPRFTSDEKRCENEAALAEFIEAWSSDKAIDEVIETLSGAGIPGAKLNTINEALASEQVAARELVTAVEHESLGILAIPEQPVHFGGVPRGNRKSAPSLGADTDAILSQLKQ